ncbi:TonB-dependent siderophore receptor [Ancylobacter sp. SL191]|uniref:TonB-dependent siderophore receptor n=1 Tax=Ancylobacter sp. SL191 TaxID=2995166 RepID=UPI00226DB157|nr:TonB-dependent siderophore receptor [Ancylobacter sp. SL191]WAC27686.1 TonB-dependent siderophore receptor [Ancylobacter sp. SL191]
MVQRTLFRHAVSIGALLAAMNAAMHAAAAQQAPIALETVTVEEAAGADADPLLQTRNATATGTNTPVLETPLSVTSVTRRQMDEQNPQTVSEALRYTAGVLSDRDTNARYDSIFIRGFGSFGTATNYVSFLDGLQLPRGQAFAQTSIDPFLLERVDVLKGPAALLYGAVSPGGIVNQISRSPTVEPHGEVFVQGGTYDRIQAGLASSGAITKDGTWQYSFSLVGRDSGTQYDGVDEQRLAVAPIVTWQPDADTSLTLRSYYQKDPDGGYFNSLYPSELAPAAYKSYLNRDLNVGDPDFDSFSREQYGIGYAFEHRFDDMVSFKSSLRYSHVDVDFQSLQMFGPISADGLIPRAALQSIEEVGGVASDNHLQFDFSTGAFQHTALFGIDYENTSSSWQYLMGGATSLNVVNPQYGQPVGALSTVINADQSLWQTGIYAQDQISFGQFRALLGIRHDWVDQNSENLLTNTSTVQDSEATTYRAGLLYLFDNGLAPYVSYATSFEPVSGVDISGTPFVPSTAEQYEIGLKYQPEGLNALFTMAAFDIRQQNVLTQDVLTGLNVQQGEVQSRGIELEARGNVTRNIELIAAVTFLDTEVTESSNPADIGKRPPAVPNYFSSFWASYTFDSGTFNGLMVAGGVRIVGPSYADNANTLEFDGYTLVDAALSYDLSVLNKSLKGFKATLNVTNLLDTEYYSSCSSSYYCQFGNGRLVLAGLRYTW